MSQTGQPHGNPNGSVPGDLNSGVPSDIEFPNVDDWARYCNTMPTCNQAKIGKLCKKLTEQGFLSIDQLTRDHIGKVELANSIGAEVGTVGLIIRYADEDICNVFI